MIHYASDKRMFTLLSTNGNTQPDSDEIVTSGLDSLIISLDGASQETYNKYRINGKLSEVLDLAKRIVKSRSKMNRKNPLLRWQFLMMKHNEHEIPAIRKLAKEIKVDNLEFKTVQIYSKEDIEKFLPQNPRYRRYRIKGDNFELKAGIPNRCRRIWVNAVINWNGEMAVCCFDKDIDQKIGNLEDKNILNLWKGNNFQSFRQQILKDRRIFAMCRNCGESVRMRVRQSRIN